MKWIRSWFKELIENIVLQRIQIGGHCGLCGNWIPNELYPRYWAIGICGECLDEYEGHEELIDTSKIDRPKEVGR